MSRGAVYLVGAGPGDPGLLTVRGQSLLRQADVVVYDHLVSPRLLAACPPAAKLIYVGKEAKGSDPRRSQDAINRLLIRSARSGKTVVRLKGGDPFVFGRGGEEALALRKAGIPFEIIPGVTSAIAVPAYAGIPVTDRQYSSSLAVITGHEDPTKPGTAIRWDRLATACDTIVALMGVATLPALVEQLIRHGRSAATPCAVIEWGTLPAQRTVTGTLATIATAVRKAGLHPPAVLVVGNVVRLRRRLNWFETKPLFGRRILVTRASDKAGALIDRLTALGAEAVELPAIELAPAKRNGLFRNVLKELPQADWVFFTSPEGIGWFARLLKPYRKDLRCLAGCHIGAIGPKTAVAIEERGLRVDFIPRAFSQEGILRDLPKRLLAGKQALIFSAEASRDVLEDGLRRRGMRVTKAPIYRAVLPKPLLDGIAAVARRPFDYVTVTSASCADHLFQALQAAGLGPQFRRWRFASIGPVTSAAVRAHGGHVALEAKTSTIEGLLEALLEQRTGNRGHGCSVDE